MKLGKIKSANPPKFRLSKYIDLSRLPKPPARFGHEDLVPIWQMLANDQYGDCVWAGAAHETMLWSREGDAPDADFDDHSVLSDYSAVTGFDPANPDSDRGTDMQQAAAYRRNVGILDSSGNRHKVAAYLAIDPGNLQEHYVAIYLFGAVGMGLELPSSAMDQFDAGQPWRKVSHSSIAGGHYVPLVAREDFIYCVTWGKLQAMSPTFFRTYNDESIAYVSEEALTNKLSPEGFDYATLVKDLNALG